jgi:hypothetical protein
MLVAAGLFFADQTGVCPLPNGLPVWGFVLLGLVCIVLGIMKRRLYIGVGAAILLAFVVGLVIGGLIAEPKEWPPRPIDHREYALVTWEERSGSVCFKMMFNFEVSGVIHGRAAKRGGRCGVSELKEALSAVPAGSYVYWYTWPSKFDYPASVDTDGLIDFARSNGVSLRLTPAMQ